MRVPAEEVLFAWSGGKDSAMALYEIKKEPAYKVVALLTTVTEDYDRISMHGVRRELLEEQAESLGLPLEIVFIPKGCSNSDYESRMLPVLKRRLEAGVTSVCFGDIFLEELRRYRERNLSTLGMKGLFPLWKRDSRRLAADFISSGFKAVIACTDSDMLDMRFVGREYDEAFLSELPATVDPCGENGEFHSFVHDGPIFRKRVKYIPGEKVLRNERFWYVDLIPDRRAPGSGSRRNGKYPYVL